MEPKNRWVVEEYDLPKAHFPVPCGSVSSRSCHSPALVWRWLTSPWNEPSWNRAMSPLKWASQITAPQMGITINPRTEQSKWVMDS